MANLRLSAQSLLFYQQSKNSTSRHQFASDSSDSDEDSSSSSYKIVLTPRLKAQSKQYQSDENIKGVTPMRAVSVNLAKRLSENVLNNTPSRILQLALQDDSEDHQDDAMAQITKTRPKTQQVSMKKDQENTANNLNNAGLKSQQRKKRNVNPISDYEASDLEVPQIQQLENKIVEEIPLNVSSKRKTTASARLTVTKENQITSNPKSKDSFEPAKIEKKSKPPNKRRGKTQEENPSIETTDASKPPNKKGRKNKSENLSSETADQPEPKAKRPRVASKKKVVSSAEPAIPSIEDEDQIPKGNLRDVNLSNTMDGEKMDVSKKSTRKAAPSQEPKPTRGRPRKSVNISTSNVTVTEKCAPKDDMNSHKDSHLPEKSHFDDNSNATKENISISRYSTRNRSRSYQKQVTDKKEKGLLKRTENVLEAVEEAETPQLENLSTSINKTTDNSQGFLGWENQKRPIEKKYNFSSSSESEDNDDEDDCIFFSNNPLRKTTSPKIAAPSDIFQTPTFEHDSPRRSPAKSNPKPPDSSPTVPLLRTPSRKLSLTGQFVPNRDEQQSNSTEDAAAEIFRASSTRKTPLKTASVTRSKSGLKTTNAEMILNTNMKEAEIKKKIGFTQHTPLTTTPSGNGINAISCLGNKSSGEPVSSKTKSSAASSKTPSPRKLEVPLANRATRFDLYTNLIGPVRALQLLENDDYRVTWIHLLPKVIFPIITSDPMMVMRLAGSVEFRSDPYVPSEILLNKSTKLIQLKADVFLHVVNTGAELASFQITEMLQ